MFKRGSERITRQGRKPKAKEEVTKTRSISVIAPETLCQLKTEGNSALLFCEVLSDYLNQVYQMIGVASKQTPPPDAARIVAAIDTAPEQFAGVESVAELAGLPPTRFQHVFTETVSMPFRRYRLWRRMGRVIRALANGERRRTAKEGERRKSATGLLCCRFC